MFPLANGLLGRRENGYKVPPVADGLYLGNQRQKRDNAVASALAHLDLWVGGSTSPEQ